MEAGEKIRKTAAHQARAIDGILEADGRDDAQMRHVVAGEVRREALRIARPEHQHAIQVVTAAQRYQCQTGEAARLRYHLQVLHIAERTEPGPVEFHQLRRQWQQ